MNYISLLLSLSIERARREAVGLQLFADFFPSCEGGAGTPRYFKEIIVERGKRQG